MNESMDGWMGSTHANVLRRRVIIEESGIGEARLVFERRENDSRIGWNTRALSRTGWSNVLLLH